jgi:putative sterol carrier protein
MKEELLFLSPEWIHEVTSTVQGARAKDEEFRKLTSGYSLNLVYVLSELPFKLKKLYSGKKIVLSVQLDKGRVKKLDIGTELPDGKIDFTIHSDYSIAKQIFTKQLNPATAFINRQLKVEPLSTVYRRPRFTAKSIVAGSQIIEFARQVPTRFVQDET